MLTAVEVDDYYYYIQDAPIKNNPLEKLIYFSNGSTDSSQTFRLYM